MAKPKRESEKIVGGNPHASLLRLQQELQIEQFRVRLLRKDITGKIRQVNVWQGMSADDIASMQDWLPTQFGGGSYQADIYHPQDPKERYVSWTFDIEGDPIHPQHSGPGGLMEGLQGPQPSNMPHIQPPPIGPPYRGPYPGMPNQQYNFPGSLNSPYALSRRGYGDSAREAKLEAEIDRMRSETTRLQQQLQDERHRSELQHMRDALTQQMENMRSASEKQIEMLASKLEQTQNKKDNDGGGSRALIELVMKNNEMQQQNMIAMLNREGEDRKSNLKYMEQQLERDLTFRKEMFEMVQHMNDPSKGAELMNLMGQQVASQLNLLSQVAQSGLLSSQEGEPAWLSAVKDGFATLQSVGSKFIDSQQHKQQMGQFQQAQLGQHMMHPRDRPMMPPVTQRPQISPGAPAQPPRPPEQKTEPEVETVKPGTGSGFGQPVRDKNGEAKVLTPPPSPPKPQDPVPPLQEPIPMPPPPAPSGQSAPSIVKPLEVIVQAMASGADPEIVADMIHTHVSWMRSYDMIPAEFAGIFQYPEQTLKDFFAQYVPGFDPPADYLKEICQEFMQIEKDFIEGVEDEVEVGAEDNVVDIPSQQQVEQQKSDEE